MDFDTFEKINEEQHKNILARVDYSISLLENNMKEMNVEIKELQISDKAQGKDITFAKGLASALGVVATVIGILGVLVLFIPH